MEDSFHFKNFLMISTMMLLLDTKYS